MKPVQKLFAYSVCFCSMCATVFAQGTNSEASTTPQAVVDRMQSRVYGRNRGGTELSTMNNRLEWINLNISKARLLFQEGKYKESATVYEEVCAVAPGSSNERWELAEAWLAGGDADKALEWYRKAFYQTITYKQMRNLNGHPSPRAILPSSAKSWEEIAEQSPNAEVESWADCSPFKLGRFAALLSQKGEIAEALAVYQKGLESVSPQELRNVLSLGNLSERNFESRRFIAAAYTLSAAGFDDSALVWCRLTKVPMEQGKIDELNRAIITKPDYAPALYMKADALIRSGKFGAKIDHDRTWSYLDQAEQYARSNDLRLLIKRLRTDSTNKLR